MDETPRYRIDTGPLKKLDTFEKVRQASGLRIDRPSVANRYSLMVARDHLIDAIEDGDLDEDSPQARGRTIRRLALMEIPAETWDLYLDAYHLGAHKEKFRVAANEPYDIQKALYDGLVMVYTRLFASLIDYAIENGKGREL